MYLWSPSPCQVLWDLQLLHDNDPINIKRETYLNIIRENPLSDDEIKEIEDNEEYAKVRHIFNSDLERIDNNFQRWKKDRKISLKSNARYVATETGIRNECLSGGVGKVNFYDVKLLQDGTCYIKKSGLKCPGHCDYIEEDGRVKTMDAWGIYYPHDYIITGTKSDPFKFIA